MKAQNQISLRATLILAFMLLASCTTQLAPKYDAALFEGITTTNNQVMSLLASVAAGSDASTFSQREPAYNSIVGALDALAVQSKARPMPDNDTVQKANAFLDARGIGAIIGDEVPSAAALEQASKLIARMKEEDRESGLAANVVAVFKNGVIISMDQAITYESFLNR